MLRASDLRILLQLRTLVMIAVSCGVKECILSSETHNIFGLLTVGILMSLTKMLRNHLNSFVDLVNMIAADLAGESVSFSSSSYFFYHEIVMVHFFSPGGSVEYVRCLLVASSRQSITCVKSF